MKNIYKTIMVATGLSLATMPNEIFGAKVELAIGEMAIVLAVGDLSSLLGIAGGLAAVIITIVIIAITVIPILFVVYKFMSQLKQNNELLAQGESAQARVLKIWDTGVTVNDNPQIGMILEIHPANGAVYQTEVKSLVSRLKIPLVQEGSLVPVKFDRQNPARVALAI